MTRYSSASASASASALTFASTSGIGFIKFVEFVHDNVQLPLLLTLPISQAPPKESFRVFS